METSQVKRASVLLGSRSRIEEQLAAIELGLKVIVNANDKTYEIELTDRYREQLTQSVRTHLENERANINAELRQLGVEDA